VAVRSRAGLAWAWPSAAFVDFPSIYNRFSRGCDTETHAVAPDSNDGDANVRRLHWGTTFIKNCANSFFFTTTAERSPPHKRQVLRIMF
jgi:hypothetical protein